MRGSQTPKRVAVVREVTSDLLHAGAGRCGDLNLQLQHFGHHVVAELFLRLRKKFFVHATDRVTRLRVEQEVFFFHA